MCKFNPPTTLMHEDFVVHLEATMVDKNKVTKMKQK